MYRVVEKNSIPILKYSLFCRSLLTEKRLYIKKRNISKYQHDQIEMQLNALF